MGSIKYLLARENFFLNKKDVFWNYSLLLVVAITCVAYYPSLNNNFVSWDDPVYITGNKMITSFSLQNILKIFSTFFMGNYHPLTLLSLTLDYSLGNLNPFYYHIHNLFLHLAVVSLVFIFTSRLFNNDKRVAFVAALIFGIHPLHVESVAWVSERKDLLYTLYFFLTLNVYLIYLKNKRTLYYCFVLVFFLLSVFSKAQAVTLPLIIILLDVFLSRTFSSRSVYEKIPLLLGSLIFGIVAIFAQQSDKFLNPANIPLLQRLFYAPFGLCIYIVKFFIPAGQTSLYEYPYTAAGTMPFFVYFSPIVFPILALAIWKTWKDSRPVAFGLLFFLIVIFPVLQIIPTGMAIVSERYTYVPYYGLGLAVAIYFWKIHAHSSEKIQTALNFSGILLTMVLVVLTLNRAMVWHNSLSLWTDVWEKNPRCALAFMMRSKIFNETRQYDLAIKDCNDGLQVDPDNAALYLARGIAYEFVGKYRFAVDDYTMAIIKQPSDIDSYLYRGILYTDKFEKYDSGIADFKKYLKSNTTDIKAVFNIGVAYYKSNQPDSALAWFLKVVQLNPENGQAHNLLTYLFYHKKDYHAAFDHAALSNKFGATVDSSLMVFLKNNQ